MKIIGIAGKARSGKDSSAWGLLKIINQKTWVRAKFADPVYEIVSIMTGVPVQDIEFKKDQIAFGNLTFRDLLIWVGMNGRKLYEDIWIDNLLKRFDGKGLNLIVTDLRFPNEAMKIRELGGYLVKVTRDVNLIDNESETSLDDWTDWDFIINNNSTFKNLDSNLQELWEKIGDMEKERTSGEMG